MNTDERKHDKENGRNDASDKKPDLTPPPKEPRVGDDDHRHPRPAPGTAVPGVDNDSDERGRGAGYDRGSAERKKNDHFWSSEDN